MVSDKKNSEDNNLAKKELRVRYKEASKAYLQSPSISSAIVENLIKILPQNCTIGAFRHLSDEPCLDSLFDNTDFRFAFPRLSQNQMCFYVPNVNSDFEMNEFGISEPVPESSEVIEAADLQAIIVPALAYDRKLSRLGRGKGYYDRFLSQYNGLKIGVCSVVQVSNVDLPVDTHDVAMDVVVTDQFLLRRFDA
ncbi:MAG: 5-formyltetrahydrofolate cyclo-ligase [Bdellovibrionales bacterium]|nr:5-formyltetrahydrofolate cyclo-ligase [Bdellovibrionales bacterium]